MYVRGMSGPDVQAAVKALRVAVEEAAACGPDLLSASELFSVLDDLQTVACQLPWLRHQLLARLQTETTPHALGAHTWREALKLRYRLSGSEANRWLTEAEVFGPRQALTGEPLEPVLATTAAAQARGDITGEHADVIRKAVGRVPGWVDTATREKVEAHLVATALGADADQVTATAKLVLFLLDQDGPTPDDAERARRRGVKHGQQGEDLMTVWRLTLTPEAHAVFEVLMARFGAPGMCNPDDPEPCIFGTPTQEQIDNDHRTLAQRQHDALLVIGRIALMSGDLGKLNGLPVTVIIRTTLQDLHTEAGLATTGGGTLLPISDVLRMAAHANHHLAVFDGASGSAVAHFRSKRVASPGQRIMLIARDGGCTKPGCTVGAYGCQAHHAELDWTDGGNTNVDEMGLACPPHNRQVDTDDPTAWTTTMNHHHEVEWYPPETLDTGQQRVNTRHRPERILADLANHDQATTAVEPVSEDTEIDTAAMEFDEDYEVQTESADDSEDDDDGEGVAKQETVGADNDTDRRAYLINTGLPTTAPEPVFTDEDHPTAATTPEEADSDAEIASGPQESSAAVTADPAAEPGGPAPPTNDAA
ncbi:HNH endonuclease signature motif containing protein [Mycolicibacterium phlei]